mmetsp:Transcript_49753/g.128001  ORF Transcript_49753/g.128001 Transcript_49753/m.128001 type:complete len:158 (-) Transcript_49753:21-494(-)
MCTNATARRAPKRCISYIFAMGMVPHLSPVTSHLTPHATQGHLRRASIPRPPILSHTHIACRRMHFHTLAHVLTAYVRSRAHTHVSIYLCPFVYVHIFVQKAVEVFALISAFKQLGYRSAPHPFRVCEGVGHAIGDEREERRGEERRRAGARKGKIK